MKRRCNEKNFELLNCYRLSNFSVLISWGGHIAASYGSKIVCSLAYSKLKLGLLWDSFCWWPVHQLHPCSLHETMKHSINQHAGLWLRGGEKKAFLHPTRDCFDSCSHLGKYLCFHYLLLLPLKSWHSAELFFGTAKTMAAKFYSRT